MRRKTADAVKSHDIAHPPETTEDRGRSLWRVVTASSVGNLIEQYDFILFASTAALVFDKLFFPQFDPLVGTLAAFATYGAGFVTRPLGGIVFGHFGDRVGRKSMMVITMLMMGLSTFSIGLLPTYASLGILAPALLVLLRLLQGFTAGGEYGAAAVMIVEHSPGHRRGFYGSWFSAGAPSGLLLATALIAMFSSMPDEQYLSWGWRIPFLLSIVLVGFGLFVRLKISESSVFTRVKQANTESRAPIVHVLRHQLRDVVLAAGVHFGFHMFIYISFTFLLSYTTKQMDLPGGVVLTGTLIGSALQIAAVLAFAALSDRLGRRPVIIGGALFQALYALPMFLLVQSGQPALVVLAVVVAFAGSAATYGPMAAYIAELFATRVRFSGASLGWQAGTVFSGLSPFIATGLTAVAGGSPWFVAAYVVVGGLVMLVSVRLLPETFRKDLAA